MIVLLGQQLLPDGSPSLALQTRVAAAVAMSKQKALPVLVTGGSVSQGNPPEAVVMNNLLLARGVAADMVLQETKAFNTIENARFALPMLHENGVKTAVLMTSDFHMKRSMVVFESVLEGSGIELVRAAVPTGRPWCEHLADLKFELYLLQTRMVPWLESYGFTVGVQSRVAAAVRQLQKEMQSEQYASNHVPMDVDS